jgi:hypothetical protein
MTLNLEEVDSSEDDEPVDPRAKDLELKRKQQQQQWRQADFGMDYEGDKEAGAGDNPNKDPETASMASTALTEDAEWETGVSAPVAGDCERSWKHHGKSQAVVIAMAQGLVRVCEEPYQVLYVFESGKR